MADESLAKLPIFQGMSDKEIHEALSCTQHVDVGSGDHVIVQGKQVQNLWFIREGQCEVRRRTDGGCVLKLAELGPDAQFGEMSFFHAAPHSADVIAITPMKLLRLSREDYDQLCAEGNPIATKLAMNSLEILAERLRKTDDWITELVCQEDRQPTASEWTSFRTIIFGAE